MGQALTAACVAELVALGVDEDKITHVAVPGALEVPLALAKLAQVGDFDELVAIGAVIRGETYHFEMVANESAAAITRLTLDAGVPIANAILTAHFAQRSYADTKRIRRGRGRGTSAASRCMNSSGDMPRCVVPSRQAVLSLSTTYPAALVCTRSLASAEPGHKQSSGLFVPGEGSGHWPGAACKAGV